MIDYHLAHRQKGTFFSRTDGNYCISHKAESTFLPERQKLLSVQGLIATICQKAASNHLHKQDINYLVKGERQIANNILKQIVTICQKIDSDYMPKSR